MKEIEDTKRYYLDRAEEYDNTTGYKDPLAEKIREKMNFTRFRCSKSTHHLLFLILFLLGVQILSCAKKEQPEPTYPLIAIPAIAWNPDGSTIAVSYTPLIWDSINNYYTGIYDSMGLWFIEPDGSNLTMFLQGNFSSLDWHPNGEMIIVPGYVIDVTDTTVSYLYIGAYPRYNPDGSKISYTIYVGDSMGLWIVNSDGTGAHRIAISAEMADWAPNGRELVYVRYPYDPTPLVIADTNGTVTFEIPLPETHASRPLRSPASFSPDGEKILFDYQIIIGDFTSDDMLLSDWQIYVINRDGTGLEQLTEDGGVFPVWNPDGQKIAYVKHSHWGSEEAGDGQLWVMNADGSDKKQLTFVRD